MPAASTSTAAGTAYLPSALGWLVRRPPPLPILLWAHEVGSIVFQVLIHDGVARRVRGDLAIPADVPETPDIRAAAAQPLVPARAVVGRAAAVWVHAGGPAPARIDVLVLPRARRPDPHPGRVPHECVLPEADVVGVGPLRVTSVARTALDVARWSPGPEARILLGRLAAGADLDAIAALERLDGLTGYRNTRPARTALAATAKAGEPP